MKNKIRIDTLEQAKDIVNIASAVEGRVVITDNAGLSVNAKSMLGALHAMEFEELWIESETDIYSQIEPFVVLESHEPQVFHK